MKLSEVPTSFSNEDVPLEGCAEKVKRPLDRCNLSEVPSSGQVSVAQISKKKGKKDQWSQLTLKSFFQRSSVHSDSVNECEDDSKANRVDTLEPSHQSGDSPAGDDDQSENLSQSDSPQTHELSLNPSASTPDQNEVNTCSSEKNSVALQEWQRIQQRMQNSIPLCKGHKEPCVARVVKKQGPNYGRRFYVCARAEVYSFMLGRNESTMREFPSNFNKMLYVLKLGSFFVGALEAESEAEANITKRLFFVFLVQGPSSNLEANCGYFKWAVSKSRGT